jgi:predicted transport protein
METKVYTERFHRTRVQLDEGVWETYESLRDNILEWEDVEVVPRQYWITVQTERRRFLTIKIQKSQVIVSLELKKGDLNDPRGITRDVSESGNSGYGDYFIHIRPGDDLDYSLNLIRQSYDYWENSG